LLWKVFYKYIQWICPQHKLPESCPGNTPGLAAAAVGDRKSNDGFSPQFGKRPAAGTFPLVNISRGKEEVFSSVRIHLAKGGVEMGGGEWRVKVLDNSVD
jgi:hypothetical protein